MLICKDVKDLGKRAGSTVIGRKQLRFNRITDLEILDGSDEELASVLRGSHARGLHVLAGPAHRVRQQHGQDCAQTC